MTGKEFGKMMLRFVVRVIYLVLLGGTGGVIFAMLGYTEGISPFILIVIMILYWSTIQKVYTKLGIAKPVLAATKGQ
jgi:hypothetical protein